MKKVIFVGNFSSWLFQPLASGVSRLVGKSPDCPKPFQIVRKPSRLSRNLPDCPETFQTFTMFSLDFKPILLIRAKTFQTRKNFLVGNAYATKEFFCLWPIPAKSAAAIVMFFSKCNDLLFLYM